MENSQNRIHTVTSLVDFINIIKKLSGANVTGNFYRGQRNSSWGLESGLERCKNTSVAQIKNGYGMFKNKLHEYYADCKNMSDLEIMVLAQHYGLPTRLLDWTTSPLSALYFAIYQHDVVLTSENDINKIDGKDTRIGPGYILQDNRAGEQKAITALPSVDAVVYVLPSNVLAAHYYVDEFENKISCLEKQAGNFNIFYDDILETVLSTPHDVQPILLTAPISFSRIAKQKGVFTLMRSVIQEIETKKEKVLRQTSTLNLNLLHKIIIRRDAIIDIYADMMRLGYGPTSLFDDIDSLAEEIKFSYFGGNYNKISFSTELKLALDRGEINLIPLSS